MSRTWTANFGRVAAAVRVAHVAEVSLCSARLLLAFCVACFDFTLEMLSIASTKTCILRPCCMSAPSLNKFLAVNVGSSSSSSSGRRRRVHQQQRQHKQLQNEENNTRNCNAKKAKAKAEKRKVQRKRAEKVSRMPRRHLKFVFMNRPAQAALQAEAGDGDVAGARAKVEAKANAGRDRDREQESKSEAAPMWINANELMKVFSLVFVLLNWIVCGCCFCCCCLIRCGCLFRRKWFTISHNCCQNVSRDSWSALEYIIIISSRETWTFAHNAGKDFPYCAKNRT